MNSNPIKFVNIVKQDEQKVMNLVFSNVLLLIEESKPSVQKLFVDFTSFCVFLLIAVQMKIYQEVSTSLSNF